jgi:hypothetical protein
MGTATSIIQKSDGCFLSNFAQQRRGLIVPNTYFGDFGVDTSLQELLKR